MPLTPYQYRPATPPTAADVPALIEGSSHHSRNFSGSSSWSANSSPDSIDIHIQTPLDRSPIRQHGPTLLPKIRTQDTSLVPSAPTKTHRRALSQQYNPPAQAPVRPTPQRSVTVPPECNSLLSPISATSTNFSCFGDNLSIDSPITLTPSIVRKSVSHARSSSASSVDEATLGRYGYPTYRRRPSYMSQAYWSSLAGSATFIPPTLTRPAPQHYDLPSEMLCAGADEETLTSTSYLSAPNPAIDLVRQVNMINGRGMHQHFWWDIRNLESWDSFTLSTIHAIPSFPQLLSIPINRSAFPTPTLSTSQLRPETEANLVEAIRDFHAAKLNAAVKVTQGSHRHMAMRVCAARDGPAFISSYTTDADKTLLGTPRGRVVGVVRSYERWNSSLRSGNGNDKVRYLEGLSFLHRHMREHGTRYGFIMTETELVCARAGTNDVPFFGHLELSDPIEMRSAEGMTVCLGLWFLHMLAKEEPLPGQVGWRMNVGAPQALTRRIVMEEKDEWMPSPQVGEKREAKRIRGWVLPADPWNKKREAGKGWNR
ncbi:MAG: hypothetical protein MMC23_001148 [Stictis urceolatum]|nr:hypothetical protein [Stictis urceolata]